MSNTKLRGFGTLARTNPEKHRRICSAGGTRAHEIGAAHTYKKGKEAEEAGRKGGLQRAANARARQGQ